MITPHLHVSADSLHPLHDHYPVYPSQWMPQDETIEWAAIKEFQIKVVSCHRNAAKGRGRNSELKS